MKGAITRIILFVDDIAKMSDFYAVTFELEKLPGESEGFVCFAAGGCELCLHSIPVQYRSADGEYPKREGTPVKVVFESNEIDDDRQRLVELGIPMTEIFRFGSMAFCDGTDPEGNIFQISSR